MKFKLCTPYMYGQDVSEPTKSQCFLFFFKSDTEKQCAIQCDDGQDESQNVCTFDIGQHFFEADTKKQCAVQCDDRQDVSQNICLYI